MIGSTLARAVVAVCCAVLWTAPVLAQEDDDVGLQVQPAQTEPPGPIRNRRFSSTLTFTNRDPRPYAVDLQVTELGHDLEGTPVFAASEKHERAFSVDGERFTVEPEEQEQVHLSGSIPRSDRSMYLGVVADFSADDEGSGGVVSARSRLAAQFLLRGPKPWDERVEVTDVGILPGRGDRLTVYAILENTGNVHVRPTGTIRIRRGDEVLDTVPLEPKRTRAGNPPAILPGYARRLTGSWRPPAGLGGAVRLEATIADPRAFGARTVSFEDGAAAVPAAEIRNLVAFDDDGAHVVLELVNTGSTRIAPAVELFATQGEIERARTVLPQRALRAREERALGWSPSLGDGTYRITARAVLGRSILDEKVVGLRIGAAQPGRGRGATRWIAIVAALLILLVLVLLFLSRRRRREEGAATRTAAPR